MSRNEVCSYQVERTFGPFFTGDFVEFTKDFDFIICQCLDSVNIVEIESSKVIHSIPFEDDEVTCLSLSPNYKTLIVATKSNLIHQYNLTDNVSSDTPIFIRKFKSFHASIITTLCWDSSSTLLATGSADGTSRIWNISQKFCTHHIKMNTGVVRNLLFVPDMKTRPWLISSAEHVIFIWELLEGSSKLISKFEDGHHSQVSGMIYIEETNKLITCGLDKVIVLWDLENFKLEKVVPTFESVLAVVLQPDDTPLIKGSFQNGSSAFCVMAIGEKGFPSLWDIKNTKCLWQAKDCVVQKTEQGGIAVIKEMKYIQHLNCILITTYQNSIMFFELGTMKLKKQLIGSNDDILDICFIGEKNSHLALASNSSQLKIYDSSNLSCQVARGHSATIISLARHPTDHNIFSSGSRDNSALIWKLSNGSVFCIGEARGHINSINTLVFGKDFLFTGGDDMFLKKWDFNGKIFAQSEHTSEVISLQSSLTEKAHSNSINCLSLSPNGKFVATASQDKSAKVWDSSSLSLLGTLKGHRKSIWFIDFSPVDQLIATSSADGAIKIWVLPGLTNASTLEGHDVSVVRFCWINNGTQILSAAADGILKLWSLKKGTCVQSFDEHDAKVWGLAHSNDGQFVVSGGEDGKLVFWRDVTEEEQIKKQEEHQKMVRQDQLLQNLMREKKWTKALLLSIRLAQPHRGLTIMKHLLDEEPDELYPVLSKLSLPKLMSLLEFAIQWNTKTTNVREAQIILKFALESYTMEELEVLPSWKDVIECFLPYTERHFNRVSNLSQSSNIINYIVSCNNFSLMS